MKRLLSVVSVLALVLPAAATAQQPNTNQSGAQSQNRGQHRPNRPNNRPGQPSIQPVPSRPGNRPGQGHRPPTIQPVPNKPNRPGHGHRPPVTIQPIKPGKPHRPGYRPPHVRPIHRPPFHYPHGYHYRRWHIGWVLPHIFLSNSYYFNDWAMLGFGPPPPGYVWVRYGPDLLLVNRHTGRIRDVVYNVFY
jgi:Ni/Co efflux regulator RcnB